MGCCNDKRATWATSIPGGARPETLRMAMAPPPIRKVAFEYTGGTGLQVLGPVTKVRYRFPSQGTMVEVDARDAPYMAGVPNLRRARG